MFIHRLVSTGSYYFLSRPRRFGKSLLVSTMEEYFKGNKELFEGLSIYCVEEEWIEYPVIKISFAGNEYSKEGNLENHLDKVLSELEQEYGLEKKYQDPAERLSCLIAGAYKKTGKRVVILIDEYDKPILDAIFSDLEEKNRATLRGLYGPLKECDDYIYFCFVTGITKIDHVNIFSGLNQLEDISRNKDYSSICGITEAELYNEFQCEILELAACNKETEEEAKSHLKRMNDGYHFSKSTEGVYNPFSVFLLFKECDYGQYWFSSATPSFLIKLIKESPLLTLDLINDRNATLSDFTEFDSASGRIIPLLYQSGYITIKSYNREFDYYTLGFPNQEVEKGFLDTLLPCFVNTNGESMGMEVKNIQKAIISNDVDGLMTIISSLVADIPTMIKKDMYENYYLSIMHMIFRLAGFTVMSELQSIYGRSDIVVINASSVFLIELKMDKGKDLETCYKEAFEQIDSKGYEDRYKASGKRIRKIALVFSSLGKGFVGYKEE